METRRSGLDLIETSHDLSIGGFNHFEQRTLSVFFLRTGSVFDAHGDDTGSHRIKNNDMKKTSRRHQHDSSLLLCPTGGQVCSRPHLHLSVLMFQSN